MEFLFVTQWSHQANKEKEHYNLATIQRAKFKGAHERFKSLIGEILEPKCKP